MSLWRQFAGGLRALGNRPDTDREIADEVSHYLEEATSTFVAKGLSPDQARRAARLELGNATAVREQVRAYGWENMVESFLSDLRYAARRLWGNPGFTAVSVMTLALGIGASATIFGVIEGVLLKPLPYPHPEQLIALLHTAPGVDIKELDMAVSLYYTYVEDNRVFQDIALWRTDSWTVTGIAEPEKVAGLSVSNRFLPLLSVRPQVGRAFTTIDEDPNGERTAILSDGYWKSRFGGDRSVPGRHILLDGNTYTVIGVLPPSFEFMDSKVTLLVPLRFDRAKVNLIDFCCAGVARLKPGVTLAEANADVARMLPMAAAKFPMNPGFSRHAFTDARIAPRLRPLKSVLVGDVGNMLWVLMGSVGIMLLIACANVANLLLVRADGRSRELGIRIALGAGWGRVARELLLESLLLGVAGCLLGLALTWCALRVLATSELALLPRIREISIDPVVLIFTIGVSLAATLLFGLIPTLRYARPAIATTLSGGGRSFTGSRERNQARNLLVVVQIALALVLLVGSGLMIRTLQALHNVDPGFSGASELETMRIGIPETEVKDSERTIRMEEEILRKIEAVAGVSVLHANMPDANKSDTGLPARVAMTSNIPLKGGSGDPVYTEDRQYREGSLPPLRRFKFVSPGYVATIGSRLIAGREMTWSELYQQAPVALVSGNMARELWHDPRAAVGKRIRASLKDDWREVIGVVADLRDNGIDQKAPTIVYWPLWQKNFEADENLVRSVAYIVRTPRAGSAAFRQEIRNAVASVNPNLPVADVRTLESVYEQSLARTSITLMLLAIAAGMALLLGVVGVFGVISYSVSQRTREVGIRLALGAPLQGVTGLFIRDGLAMSGIGAICGLTVAFAVTRLMKSVLFEVNPADPGTYIAASAALILAALVGSYLPARRATRVDPVEALRAE